MAYFQSHVMKLRNLIVFPQIYEAFFVKLTKNIESTIGILCTENK